MSPGKCPNLNKKEHEAELRAKATRTVGFDISDVTDAIGSLPGDVVDAVHLIPGVDALGNALKDFAGTALGQIFMRCLSSSFFMGFSAYMGPQLASVAFAVPGLAKGDSFASAWVQETAWRVKTTAQILAPSVTSGVQDEIAQLAAATGLTKELADQVRGVAEGMISELPSLSSQVPIPDFSKMAETIARQNLGDIAARFGARQDTALMALDALQGTHSFATPATQPLTITSGPVQIHFAGLPAHWGRRFNAYTGLEIAPGYPGMAATRFLQWVAYYNGQGPAPL